MNFGHATLVQLMPINFESRKHTSAYLLYSILTLLKLQLINSQSTKLHALKIASLKSQFSNVQPSNSFEENSTSEKSKFLNVSDQYSLFPSKFTKSSFCFTCISSLGPISATYLPKPDCLSQGAMPDKKQAQQIT